jgi:hypothetical protein
MAIIGVNQRATPVDKAQQPNESWQDKQLNKVLKALQIANAGYGIYSDYRKLEQGDRQLAAAEAKNIQETELKLAKEWKDDKRAREIESSYDATQTIEALTADNSLSPLEYSAAMMKAVRAAAGPGPISDKDIELFAPDPSVFASVKRTLNRALAGKATREDVAAFRQLAEVLRQHNIREMEKYAGWFAETQGRRVGIKDYVVNNVLQPRSRLTGAAAANQLTWRKDNKGLEGQTQAGETRVREKNIRIPTAQSPEVEKIQSLYSQGKLDKRITEDHIQQQMQKGNLTKGQAIWNLDRALKRLDEQKLQKNYNKREGARQEARDTLKALPQGRK